MTPVKPFDTYKWRWLSVQPSEGLLAAPVFLGVLRALAQHEGEAFSDPRLRDTLRVVELETESTVHLARNPARNLFRNSGQYWRGTGLLAPGQGIHLTSLGQRVAQGRVTKAEFAALMIQQTVLPNIATYSPEEVAKWRAAHLEIRPLKLILEVVEELGKKVGVAGAFLTNNQLIKVVIPLAGVKASPSEIAEHLILYRAGKLDITGWPDCAPMDNDPRLAREFLLFLANFDILRLEAVGPRDDQRFRLDELYDVDAATATYTRSIFAGEEEAQEAVEQVRHSPLPSIIERQRVLATVMTRSGQSSFRTAIMNAYGNRCFITGEEIPAVLEAAHIVPVTNGGADHRDNGLCLRVDIHRLFDSGNVRIRMNGDIVCSDAVVASANYRGLPAHIALPPFVNPANVEWRDRYL